MVDAKRYDDFTPQKLKHFGPVQKRLGTRLRKLRNKRSIKHCLKKFRIGKVDKQDNKWNNKILDNCMKWKKYIGIVLWHCSDIQDFEARHQFCLKSIHSWCEYQTDKEERQHSLLVSIKREIHKVFWYLNSDGKICSRMVQVRFVEETF